MFSIRHSLLTRLCVIAAIAVLLSGILPYTTQSVSADATPHALCPAGVATNFSQDWTNVGLITANDNWTGVSSIIGYLGDTDAGSPTGVDPTTLTADLVGAVDVIANLTNPNTSTAGGVGEFDIVNDVVALQGSGTADAPYLLLTLDSTGTTSTNIAYTVRDIDGSTDNAVQQFNVQYRVGTSGTWTNVPGGYIADASTGPSLTQDTPIAAYALPAGFNNAGTVQIRFMTTNAASIDEWLGVDDIVVTPNCTAPDPCAAITFPYMLPNNLAATLITAIECANANGASADTIDLNGQIVTLTASYADYTGATGLPQVTTSITLEGGAIIRNGGAPQFRLLNVGATGNLTLDGIIASGGSLSSSDNAGAIFNDGGTLNILNSTITNNSAGFGGALYNSGPSATMMLVDSQFTNNSAAQNGGLMMNDSGSVTILRSTVSGNSSSGASGNGAIYNFEADLDILDSTFSGNSATTNVGAVQNFNGTTNIANSVFAGNSATNTSGAVLNNAAGVMTITNSTFSGNSAASTAGALLNNGSSVLTITNSTIAGNNATSAGGIYNAGTLTITNSIVWGNSSNALIGATITHSIIEGGFAGTGNLNVDPLFVAPVAFASAPTSSGNYRLQDNSLAVDAGSNTAVPVDTYDLNNNASTTDEAPDLDGSPRRYDDTGVTDTGSGTAPIVDMGAYEKQTNTPVVAAVDYCNLQFPTLFTAGSGTTSPVVYGRIYEDDAGLFTSDPGPHPLVVGELGYGPLGSDPTGNPNWMWFATTFNIQIGNDDEYQGTFIVPFATTGTQLSYTYRFTIDGAASYTYCDSDGNGTNGGLSFSTASLGTLTISPGSAPSISIDDVSSAEGNSGTTNFTFTVSLNGPSVDPVTFDIATADGTATVANNDYATNSALGVVIPAGQTSAPFSVVVNGDTTPEPNETFFVNVTNIVNATPVDAQGQGTITNDDDICTLYSFPYTMTGNTPAELIQAITCANANGTADIIDLNGQTVTLTATYGLYSGATGLPSISTGVTLQNGTITRSGVSEFRYLATTGSGTLTLRRINLTNGGGTGYTNNGGSIFNQGVVTLIDSRIMGSTSGFGGAIFSDTGSNLTVTNSLLSGNRANVGSGGAIFTYAILTLNNSTLAGNYAVQSGGGFSGVGPSINITLNNSLSYGNEATNFPNSEGAYTSNNSLVGVNPSFNTLLDASDNAPTTGGDYRLAHYSVAIDAGDNALVPGGITNDLLGFTRFYNDTGVTDTGLGTAPIVDMGAYEKQTNSPLVCGTAPDRIYELQDGGAKFGFAGPFTVDGVVTFDGQASGQWDGFYLQDPAGDGNTSTSDGIYIFDPLPALLGVNVGDYVRVTGTVSEFAQNFSLVTPAGLSSTTETEITATSVTLCGNLASVTPTVVTLPFATLNEQERYEGMLVTFNQTLSVTELFTLGRYNEISLSLGGRLFQPTNFLAPGAAAIAQQDLNNRSRILLDDGRKLQNVDPIIYPAPALSASNTVRHGDTVASVTGVYTQANSRFGNGTSTNTNPFRYRLNPTAPVSFTPANPRPAAIPAVGGTLTVSSMNLLNYFNNFTACYLNGTFTNGNCRGANNATEFTRQRDKTIAAILSINPAVLGVNELENDIPNDNGGLNGATMAIEDLVNGLNAATAPGTYAFINTGRIGTDAIRVGMIYQPALVTPVGAHAVLDNVDPFNRNTRPALAQTFESVANGGQFTMVANHFKSKGSCPLPADPNYTDPTYGENYDTGDGQGCWNADRERAAAALLAWLATNPTGTTDPDYLVLGDLNSYAAEDPITFLTGSGYTNLIALYGGPGNVVYSYVFDGQSGYLDHALANSSMAAQVTGAAEYHINADEPSVLDYNTEFKSAGQVVSLYAANEFRVSDHDPVIVGLNLTGMSADLTITKTDGVTTAVPGGSVTYTITASNAGPDPVVGAAVADTFPAILTGTWTCVGAGGGTCTAAGSGNIGDTVNLPVGGSVTYTVSATISAAATGSLVNTATVSSSVSDPNPANNSATDTDTLTPQADLSITKTDGVTTEVPGGIVTYTITASNAGPSNAPVATVADTFPAILTGAWTCVGAGGGTCPAAGSGNISDIVNLPAGGSVTYTVSATISAAATGTLSNTATVTPAVTDPNPANNSATDVDTLTPQADLSITKTDGVTSATPGGSVTYTITASNAGPSNAPGATVADTFPAILTGTWTCVGTGGGTCTAAGAGNISDTVNLPVGGSVTYTVSATISAAATGSLVNTATVAAPGGVTDPNPANNSATDTDTLGGSADLTITKTDGVTTATPGGSVTYTITASNAGPSDVSGATVADTFPAILTGTWTCVGAGGGTCTAAGAGNISDTVNLPAGGSVTYTVTANISAAATGTLSNTATISSAVTDPNPANNSATDTDTLSGSADLSITKTDGVVSAVPGGSVTYTITASNAGPSDVTGATVADTFPAVLTGTWTCVGAGGGTCTAAGAGNISDTVNLPAGGSVTYTVTANISAAATGTLSNTATISSAVTDPNPANNSATDTDSLLVELLLNGGFETPDATTGKKAQNWKTNVPSVNNDRRLCKPGAAFEGSCAYRFRFNGTIANNGLARSIKQVINSPAVGAGDTLTFSLQSSANALVNQARAVVKVIYPTGKQKLVILIAPGTYAYTELTGTLLLTGTPTKIKVTIEPRTTTGRLYVDLVSLIEGSAPRIRLDTAEGQPLPLPGAPEGFRR